MAVSHGSTMVGGPRRHGRVEGIFSAQLQGGRHLYVRPHLGHIRLARLTPEDVEKMGRALPKLEGAATRNGSPARSCAVLSDKPSERLCRPQRRSSHRCPCGQGGRTTGADTRTSQQLFDALHDDRLLPLYVVAIHTGLRQGELLALRWSDVDLEAGTLTVTGTLDRKIRQRTDPKTDKSRRGSLTTQAMEALQLHQVRQNLEGTQGSDDLVFTSTRGTALYESNIRKHWHRVSANLGLASMPWHNLRHSAATISCPRCPHRGCVPCVRSCVHPHHRRHLWPCVAGNQQAGRGRHVQGFAMKDPPVRPRQAVHSGESLGSR